MPFFCQNSSVKTQKAPDKFDESVQVDFNNAPMRRESEPFDNTKINSVNVIPMKPITSYTEKKPRIQNVQSDNQIQVTPYNYNREGRDYNATNQRGGEAYSSLSEHQRYHQYKSQKHGLGQQQRGSEQPHHILVHLLKGPGQQQNGSAQPQHILVQQLHGHGQQQYGSEQPQHILVQLLHGPEIQENNLALQQQVVQEIEQQQNDVPEQQLDEIEVGTQDYNSPHERRQSEKDLVPAPKYILNPHPQTIEQEESFPDSVGNGMIQLEPFKREYNSRNGMNSNSVFPQMVNSISASSLSYSVEDGHMYSISQPKWRTSPTGQPIERGKFKAGDIIRRTSFCPHILCDFGGSIGVAMDGDTMCIDYVTDDLVYHLVGGDCPVPDCIDMDGLFVKVGERRS